MHEKVWIFNINKTTIIFKTQKLPRIVTGRWNACFYILSVWLCLGRSFLGDNLITCASWVLKYAYPFIQYFRLSPWIRSYEWLWLTEWSKRDILGHLSPRLILYFSFFPFGSQPPTILWNDKGPHGERSQRKRDCLWWCNPSQALSSVRPHEWLQLCHMGPNFPAEPSQPTEQWLKNHCCFKPLSWGGL